ncbi:MAG TPA: AGE family epimerase/isomerase, partial [Woeseiaceae bacterium]|nr:AGE family epimerase/isomerase [Woeseiaceae bacterium]
DLYDNAFALLALATARGVLGGDTLDPHIEQLLAALDTHMARRTAGGYQEFRPAPGYRLQNPHMHLFESLLALFAATRNTALRARIGTLGKFIERSFFNNEEACINEFAAATEAAQSGWFEPGHSMEWVWLLGWRSRLLGEPYPEFGRRVYHRALETLDADGRAVMSVTVAGGARDPSRRLWSQTETLKAHLCMMEQSRGAVADEAAARATHCAAGILGEWLEPAVAGGWLDHFGADGRLLARNMPASSGYHLYCAIAELGRLA